MTTKPFLAVEGLSISFGRGVAEMPVVRDMSFSLERGETLAIVGESGSGKTITAKSLMGLLPRGAHVTAGTAMMERKGASVDLLRLRGQAMRRMRGDAISMIFQEPMSALSPLHRIGPQVAEVLHVHGRSSGAKARVLKTFEEVGFPDPQRAWSAYPFELSGGLRQRAVIAMAMVAEPELVIADEPTTALDVTTQAMVLGLLRRLQQDHRMAVLLITHDLGVVANMADRIAVMERGRMVERGPAETVLERPGHGYTKRLIEAAPKIPEALRCDLDLGSDAILGARNLSKTYPGRRRGFGPAGPPVRALSDLSFELERGRTLAIVGESGSGKSTVARLVLRAERPDPGSEVLFRERGGEVQDVAELGGADLKRFRRKAQMVFQDPYAALSPRLSVQDILTEPLKIHEMGTPAERRERAAMLMRRVGLPPEMLGRFPFAFSGGQRQRIAIARALALSPELLVLDEPTSALDVSVQAEVLVLMDELKAELGLSYLFISHDLAVVSQLADRVMVMRAGRVVEEGTPDCIFRDARHPYTRALIAASPDPDCNQKLDLEAVAAGAGAPETWPDPYRFEGEAAPGMTEVAPGHLVRAAA